MRTALIVAMLLSLLAVPMASRAEAAKALTNHDVIQMVNAGLPESTVLLSVENAPSAFKTGPSDLAELTRAGVPSAVIQAMEEKAVKETPQTAAPHSAATAEQKPSGKTVKVFIPDEWPSADKEIFRSCVDEINVQRRQDGQAELEAISQAANVRRAWGRAALGALATVAIAVTPVGGAAGLGKNVGEHGMSAENYAQSRVTQCMAGHRGSEAQRQAIQNMTEAQQQLMQQQMQQGEQAGQQPDGK